MRRSLIVLGMVGVLWGSPAWAACTGSGLTWNSTPDYNSVASCVSQAGTGSTITVSAGTQPWSSNISWSGKSLTLVGAGIGNTNISGSLSIGLSENPPTNASRVTGFTFADSGSITIAGRGFRIDHNSFVSSAFTVAVWVESRASKTAKHKGLIDNNTFTLSRVLVYTYPGTSQTELNGTDQWYTPLALGSDEAVYVEDNTFNCAAPCINVIDANDAGRYVFRFNTVTDGYIEAHGLASYRRATRKWEVYHNTIVGSTKNVPFITFLRAGTGVVFNNTATGTFGSGYTLDHRRSYETPSIGACDGNSTWDRNDNPPNTGWLCRDQIGAGADVSAWASGAAPPAQTTTPAYLFLNTRNGDYPSVKLNTASVGTHVKANRDYYEQADGGVRYGTAVQKDAASCTVGQGYWVTNEGYWNSKTPTTAAGVLYKCTATNTWTPYYMPYPYPHPLRSGLSAPTGVTVK